MTAKKSTKQKAAPKPKTMPQENESKPPFAGMGGEDLPESPAQGIIHIEPPKEQTRGILLIAYGDKSYGAWAYNMAHSLRHHSPGVNIHLVTLPETAKDIDLSVFSTVDLFPDLPYKIDGSIDVAAVKMHLYDLSPYDQTLYLDVDGICLQAVEPWFERIFASHSVYYQVMDQGGKNDRIHYMWTASNDLAWQHFALKEDAVFATSQTSVVAFDKSAMAQGFFARLKENYKNKLPSNQFGITWGPAAHQPDELYYSGTAAQLGIVPDIGIQPAFFPREHVAPKSLTEQVVNKHLILSMWGARNLVRPWAKDYYDRLMHGYMRALYMPHIFKSHHLYDRKFSGRK